MIDCDLSESTAAVIQPVRRREEEAMPLYEFFCDRCQKEVSVTQSMSEHAKGAACPECGSRDMRPLVGTFFSKTSRKS
jgi:putative FmdB family regulatory protein